jgi:hypothetical protein
MDRNPSSRFTSDAVLHMRLREVLETPYQPNHPFHVVGEAAVFESREGLTPLTAAEARRQEGQLLRLDAEYANRAAAAKNTADRKPNLYAQHDIRSRMVFLGDVRELMTGKIDQAEYNQRRLHTEAYERRVRTSLAEVGRMPNNELLFRPRDVPVLVDAVTGPTIAPLSLSGLVGAAMARLSTGVGRAVDGFKKLTASKPAAPKAAINDTVQRVLDTFRQPSMLHVAAPSQLQPASPLASARQSFSDQVNAHRKHLASLRAQRPRKAEPAEP